MDATLFFYRSKYTQVNKELVTDLLKHYGINFTFYYVAFSPMELLVELSKAVENCDVVLILGGLKNEDKYNLKVILSKALEYKLVYRKKNSDTMDNMMLEGSTIIDGINENCDVGYVLNKGVQTIYMLPDDPMQLRWILKNSFAKDICNRYNIRPILQKNQILIKDDDLESIVEFDNRTKRPIKKYAV